MPAQKGAMTNKVCISIIMGDELKPKTRGWQYFVKNKKDLKRKPKFVPKADYRGILKPTQEKRFFSPKVGRDVVLRSNWVNNFNWEYVGYEHFVGVYINPDLTTAEYDAMFIKTDLDIKRLSKEAELMKTKWFDYRFMHFMEATYVFSRYYQDAYRAMYRKIVSHVGFKVGFTGGDDFLNIAKTHRFGFFKAREMADAHGIPYWFYCNFAMKWSIEDRIWNMPPKPNQIYSKLLMEDMIKAWEIECDVSLQIPGDPRFLLETGIDGEVQQEFQKWLCEQISHRTYPERGLNTYMNKKPMISRENALKYLGKGYVDKVS